MYFKTEVPCSYTERYQLSCVLESCRSSPLHGQRVYVKVGGHRVQFTWKVPGCRADYYWNWSPLVLLPTIEPVVNVTVKQKHHPLSNLCRMYNRDKRKMNPALQIFASLKNALSYAWNVHKNILRQNLAFRVRRTDVTRRFARPFPVTTFRLLYHPWPWSSTEEEERVWASLFCMWNCLALFIFPCLWEDQF